MKNFKKFDMNEPHETTTSDGVSDKITPERAKEVEEGINNWIGKEDNKWTIVRMFDMDILMFDGCISVITTEEICSSLNEVISLRDQLSKQEVAFRETIKIQHDEIVHLKEVVKAKELIDPKEKSKTMNKKTLYEYWLENNLPVVIHDATLLLFKAYQCGASGHIGPLEKAFPDYFVEPWFTSEEQHEKYLSLSAKTEK